MSVRLRYETHSLTMDNECGRATGWLPGELSETGRALARELGPRGLADRPAAVFVSDLARAVETARIAFGEHELPIIQDSRLRECNYGTQNGMPVEQLAASRRQHLDKPYPQGQSYQDVVAATADFLVDLVAGYDGRSVVVIAHSANKWALDHLLDGVALEDLVDAPFGWQEGWYYFVPSGFRPPVAAFGRSSGAWPGVP